MKPSVCWSRKRSGRATSPGRNCCGDDRRSDVRADGRSMPGSATGERGGTTDDREHSCYDLAVIEAVCAHQDGNAIRRVNNDVGEIKSLLGPMSNLTIGRHLRSAAEWRSNVAGWISTVPASGYRRVGIATSGPNEKPARTARFVRGCESGGCAGTSSDVASDPAGRVGRMQRWRDITCFAERSFSPCAIQPRHSDAKVPNAFDLS